MYKLNKRYILIFIAFIIILSIGILKLIFFKPDITITTSEALDKGVFLPVIMYHSIIDNYSRAGEYVVTPKTFENDMTYLYENGYDTVTVNDLVNYVYKGGTLPQKPVMITFDDGFYNNIIYAQPVFEKYNYKGIISVVGIYVETYEKANDHNPNYAYCNFEDITIIAEEGYFEIGNHSYNMHKTSARKGCSKKIGESTEDYCKILSNDVVTLQNLLTEKSGVTPIAFSYPFGSVSRESITVLRQLGFLAAFNCTEKPNYITRQPETLFSLNRYNRASGISTEQFMKRALSE